VIFLVNPDEEVLRLVVEDTTGVRPVATAPGREEEGGIGLLEKVSGLAELFFVSLVHAVGLGCVRFRSSERVVVALKVTLELQQTRNNQGLDLSPLLERVARG